ncbi:hypothetical protein V1478_007935 [Vespula squamosa]|uniref:Uncharacterized protein n=1 Tax=Vespula squamosa TaxID=30214 RepID=A0ABD2AXC3_VESSQ
MSTKWAPTFKVTNKKSTNKVTLLKTVHILKCVHTFPWSRLVELSVEILIFYLVQYKHYQKVCLQMI